MEYITQKEYNDLKVRGFDIATLNEMENVLSRSRLADQLILKIESAFSEVTLGNGIGLSEARAIDNHEDQDYRAACRKCDERYDWKKFNSDDLKHFTYSLAFFDAEGLRFHLPAYLIASLKGEFETSIVYVLTSSDRDVFSELNQCQRMVVKEYLEILLLDPDHKSKEDVIISDIRSYWSK